MSVNLAFQEKLDRACREYARRAYKHYHDEQGGGRTYDAIEHVYPQDTRWAELGLDDLREVIAEHLRLLGDDAKLSFFETSITLRGDKLKLELCLFGKKFKFPLMRVSRFYLTDDIGHDSANKTDNGAN